MKGNTYNRYLSYTLEDFLQDSYFISSVNNPTKETLSFWDEYLDANPSNRNEYLQAKLYIESIPVNKGKLSEDEISSLWNLIQNANIRSERPAKRSKRYIITAITIAAACSIGGMFVLQPFNSELNKNNDIYVFVDQIRKVDNESSETQLILSEDETVLLEQKESTITYDSENIKVDNKDLSKKEASPYNQLIVPKGKRSKLTLSDGTKIWVNAHTRVIYPVEFNEREREIYVDGEIYIDVAHNKDWPFVVKTKDVGVRVLGTQFNVAAYESDQTKRIVLVSGSVKIISKDKKNEEDILLSPNEMYEYNNNSGFVETVNVAKYISWKDGIYLFNNEKLEIVLKRLSHYYGEDIVYDQGAADLKCSGKLDLRNSLDEVLRGLALNTSPIIYENIEGKLIIKKKP